MRIALIFVLILVATAVGILAGAIAFGTSPAPQPVASLQNADAAIAAAAHDLPAVQSFQARDGTRLAYRSYAAAADRIAVLIHGSSGSSSVVHALAKSLQAAGISVYAPDMRGHGASGRKGDIDYIGQLEDDLTDLLAAIPAALNAKRVLVGHSSGGGFALRYAAGPQAARFDGYVLLAPYIGYDSPTVRPGTGGWAAPSIPRMIALSILSRFGIDWFQSLPVVAFAIPEAGRAANRTPTYSYRLWANFGPHRDWRADLRSVRQPARIVVGDKDELFVAEAFAPLVRDLRPEIVLTVEPGLNHMELVTAPAGWIAAAQAISALMMQKR